jgi:hypothetical protein
MTRQHATCPLPITSNYARDTEDVDRSNEVIDQGELQDSGGPEIPPGFANLELNPSLADELWRDKLPPSHASLYIA